MLDVTFPIHWLFNLIDLPFFAIPSTTLMPQLRHFLSAFIKAFLPIKLSFSKSTKRPRPTEKGFVSFEKSCPADNNPAGLLSAGQDFSNETNPFSVGLGRFVDLEKDNFIGKKALINADKKCRSWGIRVVDGIAKKGRSIKLNNQCIGKVTSSTWSPYQVCGVGIVLLDKSDLGPETVVDVECTDEKIHKAELCKLPMYDPKGEIVRGIDKKIPTKAEPWSGIKS